VYCSVTHNKYSSEKSCSVRQNLHRDIQLYVEPTFFTVRNTIYCDQWTRDLISYFKGEILFIKYCVN